MKLQKKLLLLVLGISFFACQANQESSDFSMASRAGEMAEEQQPVPPQEVEVERKLIKEGFVVFETENIDSTRRQIFAAIDKYEAYTSSDQSYNSPGRLSNTIVLRVPAAHFDQLLNEATAGVNRFDSKNIEVKDVTEEFVDVQARLKAKKELEARYLTLLERANSVTEVLEVEKQVGQLRADIESIEGRLKYLENRVALATLSLTFYQSVPHKNNFDNRFSEGFRNGWDNLIWFFVGLTHIWPFLLLLAGGIWLWRIRRKRSRAAKE